LVLLLKKKPLCHINDEVVYAWYDLLIGGRAGILAPAWEFFTEPLWLQTVLLVVPKVALSKFCFKISITCPAGLCNPPTVEIQ
jgi:hypothetical protein